MTNMRYRSCLTFLIFLAVSGLGFLFLLAVAETVERDIESPHRIPATSPAISRPD